MGFLCCFPGCTNKAALWSPHSFHRIPLRNKNLRQLWLVALNMDMDLPPAALKHLRVCSSHFSEDDFLRPVSDKSRRCGLKSSAVPIHQNRSMEEAMVSSSSADDKENTQDGAEKSTLSGQKHCYMHITSVQHEEVNDFTAKRWDTYRRSLQVWLELNGECQDVAQMYTHCPQLGLDDIPLDAGYHTTCYSRFTDKKAIAKVERRLAREREVVQKEDHKDVEATPSTSCTIPSPKKKLQSRSALQTTGSSPVQPAACIICKCKEKRVTKAGKRQRERLSKAATLTAGKLLNAAEIKEDQSILLYLKDGDCVALEVQYHYSCFRQYTRFLTKIANPQKEEDEPTFEFRYKLFCEKFIRQRLLVNQEVLRMGQLTKAFNELLNANKDVDASDYRQDWLKKTLRGDFPQLLFYRLTECNVSEVVFADTLSPDAVVDMIPHPSDPMQMISAVVPTRGDVGGGVVAHLQCTLCGHFSKSHAHQLSHMAAIHPTYLDSMAMGRLGRILMYQSGGRLFHCAECFYTSRDFNKLYKHIISKHCVCEEEEGGGGGAGAGAGAEFGDDGSEKGEEKEQEEKTTEGQGNAAPQASEEIKIEPDDNVLMFDGGRYHCLICGWNNKLKSCSISHLVRKHDIPKSYASQAIKHDTAGGGMEDEEASLSGELLKEEVAATAKVVRFISNRFVCLICGWKTKLKGFAISHVVRSHNVERPYRCKDCKRSFFLPSRLQQHVQSAHRPGRFACPFCCFRSQFIGGFRRHCSRCNAREEDDREEEGREIKRESAEETIGREKTVRLIKEEEEEQEEGQEGEESEQRKQITEKRTWTAMDEEEKGKETAGIERERKMRLMNEGQEEDEVRGS